MCIRGLSAPYTALVKWLLIFVCCSKGDKRQLVEGEKIIDDSVNQIGLQCLMSIVLVDT